jgi:hypothetical protein
MQQYASSYSNDGLEKDLWQSALAGMSQTLGRVKLILRSLSDRTSSEICLCENLFRLHMLRLGAVTRLSVETVARDGIYQ